MIDSIFPYLSRFTSRTARPSPAHTGAADRPQSLDTTSLSAEALQLDDRDRSIDEYYAALATQRGADNPDVQLFTQMMGNITKALKDVDKMDGDSAMQLFANTMAEAKDQLAEKGLTGSKTSLQEVKPAEPAASGEAQK